MWLYAERLATAFEQMIRLEETSLLGVAHGSCDLHTQLRSVGALTKLGTLRFLASLANVKLVFRRGRAL